MPRKSKRLCGKPGCRELVIIDSYCNKHRQEREQRRGTAASRGYGHMWRVERLKELEQHPLCVMCKHARVIGGLLWWNIMSRTRVTISFFGIGVTGRFCVAHAMESRP